LALYSILSQNQVK